MLSVQEISQIRQIVLLALSIISSVAQICGPLASHASVGWTQRILSAERTSKVDPTMPVTDRSGYAPIEREAPRGDQPTKTKFRQHAHSRHLVATICVSDQRQIRKNLENETSNRFGGEPNTRTIRLRWMGIYRTSGACRAEYTPPAAYPLREISARGYFRGNMLRGIASKFLRL